MSDDSLEEVRRSLKAFTPEHFAPGFDDRVMARFRASHPTAIELVVQRVWRVLPIGLAAAAAFAVYAGTRHRDAGQSFAESALNLQPITVSQAYSMMESR